MDCPVLHMSPVRSGRLVVRPHNLLWACPTRPFVGEEDQVDDPSEQHHWMLPVAQMPIPCNEEWAFFLGGAAWRLARPGFRTSRHVFRIDAKGKGNRRSAQKSGRDDHAQVHWH